jgi:hypothetical protein
VNFSKQVLRLDEKCCIIKCIFVAIGGRDGTDLYHTRQRGI